MSDGMQCECAAWSANECCCGADWTPKELIDARARIKELEAENADLNRLLKDLSGCPQYLRNEEQEVARLSAHIRAIAEYPSRLLTCGDHYQQRFHDAMCRRDFALSALTSQESSSQSPHPCSENSA